MFQKIGKLSAEYPKIVLLFWVLLLIGSLFLGPKLTDQLTVEGFSAAGSESQTARNMMNQEFDGIYNQTSVVVIENHSLNPTDAQFKDAIQLIEKKAHSYKLVKRTQSPISTPKLNLINTNKHEAFLNVEMNATDAEAMKFSSDLSQDIKKMSNQLDGFTVYVSGNPAINLDVNQVTQENVAKVEEIGLPIVFVLLLFVFRSLVAALLPLLVGVFSILLTTAITYLLALNMPLSALLSNVVTMLGLGVSIDYALFITQRFREELAAGVDKRQAAINSATTAGRSVFFAGLTVAASLISLFAPQTMFFTSIAIGGFVVVIMSVLVAITLLPAVLTLLGHRVDKGRIKWFSRSTSNNRILSGLINVMLKRPILFLVLGIVAVGCFTPFANQLQMHLPIAAYDELPKDSAARLGMNALVDQVGVGKAFPVQVVLKIGQGNIYSQDSLKTIDELTQRIKKLDNVSDVISLTTLNKDLTLDQMEQFYSNRQQFPSEVKDNLSTLVNRSENVTVLDVIPSQGPRAEETRQLVNTLREKVLPDYKSQFQTYVTGETAVGLDFDKKVTNSIPMVVAIILIMTFILLCIAFNSILLPLKAILLNGLVTLSTLGFLVLMYQNGYMPGSTAQPLNVSTPILLFAILFGLSIDYEVIIVSRIKENYDKNGRDNELAIKDGFITTAGMINGAASIMIAVFGVFIYAGFRFVQELGVGLAVAILFDAVIVRTILVPTTLKLLGHLSWWMPWRRAEVKQTKTV